MTPKYRSDIDGLRAVAVLSVLFFHSGVSIFSGGYVGVDVFFVISGYLITTIIVREIANNDFSIAKFYERRFRRILPALTVVITVSLIVGFLLLKPDAVIDLGQSAIATALFSSNMLFYFESGYFGGAAEMKPLLHTWSLAVEEQYYIFFPLLLILIAKKDTKHYLRWLIILGSLSFIAGVILTSIDSSAAFYWIPTRAWELFIGSILALHVIPSPSKRFIREVNTILGIAMIAFGVFLYTPETSFPGFAALLPTIGTALIIHSGSGGSSFIYKALSLRPIVFVGLISYSLYLWHWPVIVYTNILTIKEPSMSVMILMLALIFILSILSWKYIESPFRKKIFFKGRQSLLVTSAVVSVAIIVSGMVFIMNDGYPYRLTNNVASIPKEKDHKWHHWASCEKVVNRIKNGQNLCDIGKETESARFILWGDSHARALASGINLSALNMGSRGKIATQSACPPLLSIERPNRTSCNEFNQAVLELISVTPEMETVILAARWALSTKGTRYKQESGDPVQLLDLDSPSSSNLSNVELFEIGLMRTIEKLHSLGKKVVLVNPVPEVGYDVPSALVVTNITGQDTNTIIAPTIEEYRKRTEEVESIFHQIKDRLPIELVAPDIYLCGTSYCKVVIDGVPLYRDDDHLSTFGSEYISQAFDGVLNDSALTAAGQNRLTNKVRL
jgi:peptidoglycan/LPS O-acetylase OafA/YrhL